MADQAADVHIGENSPEQVAFKLYREIAAAELYGSQPKNPDRKWILDTYAECLLAVRMPANRKKP